MSRKNGKVNINIDNKSYLVRKDLTILQAAELNQIYIPTLCAHKDLSPHGGCRMCIVEVEGFRNFPTACTTPIEDGMVIRTHTAQVNTIRREIIQLFMSEHPSSCLICDEKVECAEYLTTIHKAGVTTGCRYCANNDQCELQDVVEYLDVKEINYPIFYRNQRVEKEDPFYDRDYNLCILCGRCIRMCQEVRLANVLAFKFRGRNTVIGPAYDRTHINSGCEFCGACVSVCPTGTLSEKARKWDGKPEREQISTCSFCGVGCQLRLLVKEDRIIGSLPVDDPLVNHGQLCVKGRFCITEMVNGHKRLKVPYKLYRATNVNIPWDEAIDIAVEKLKNCPPEKFGMLISANCTNEDLYVAQKFTRVVMDSNHIDSSARLFYGEGINAYLNLLKKAVPLSEARKADVILCIGLDTRYGRSVVGVELRWALKEGAKVITINPRDHNIALLAEQWIQPGPGTEIDIIERLIQMTNGKPVRRIAKEADQKNLELNYIAQSLKNASKVAILVGSEIMQYSESVSLLLAIEKLAIQLKAGILPLPAQNNLFGSILMGSYPEFLPGGYFSGDKGKVIDFFRMTGKKGSILKSEWNINSVNAHNKLEVLYLVGEIPPDGTKNPAEFIIAQNIYPPDTQFQADLALPAAAFTESDGTFINGEGRIQKVNKAVNPPGKALPDWQILCKLAQRMGIKGFEFKNAAEIHAEIAKIIPEFSSFKKPGREAHPLVCEGKFQINKLQKTAQRVSNINGSFLLTTSVVEHSHRSIPLTTWVKGTQRIFSEGFLEISPQDAKKARIEDGDTVIVSFSKQKTDWPAKISPDLPQGSLHLTVPQGNFSGPNPQRVRIRKKNV